MRLWHLLHALIEELGDLEEADEEQTEAIGDLTAAIDKLVAKIGTPPPPPVHVASNRLLAERTGAFMPLELGDDENVNYSLQSLDDANNVVPFAGTAAFAVDGDGTLVTLTDNGNGTANVRANGPLGGPVTLSVSGTNADGSPLQNADGSALSDAITIVPTAAVGEASLVAGTPTHN